MRLGIISDSHHYQDQDGRIYNLSILKAQFEQLAGLFDTVLVCAPLIPGDPPASHSEYVAANIRLLPVTNAGGNTPKAKLALARRLPAWRKAIHQLISQVDAVHIRCPNNISIPGLFALQRSQVYRQGLYTGNWQGYRREPFTYKFQRWYLKYVFRGPVAVYGHWPDQPGHIHPSFSPSYSAADWELESGSVSRKIFDLRNPGEGKRPIQLLTVGALNQNKNQQLAIHAVRELIEGGEKVELHLLGDGELKGRLQSLAAALNLQRFVRFHGHQPHEAVRSFYRQADFVVQPSHTEGFSKVPQEAMVHGVIPILSDLMVNREITGDGLRGRTFPQGSSAAIAGHIAELAGDPEAMVRMIQSGRAYTRNLSLEAWKSHIQIMLEQNWAVPVKQRGIESLAEATRQ
ncbi:MAG: glycosyltransferase [Anaerolineales bacterium]|nr:glycosyltransferase [Anaerolineales bacterium]